MSILGEAYKLCKAVQESPSRAMVKNLLESLNSVPQHDLNTEQDRSHFGYIARQANAQILGYLMVDQERDKLNQGPYPVRVPPLKDDERRILSGVHGKIADLNKRCTLPIIDNLPEYAKLIDPYNQYNYIYSEKYLTAIFFRRIVLLQ